MSILNNWHLLQQIPYWNINWPLCHSKDRVRYNYKKPMVTLSVTCLIGGLVSRTFHQRHFSSQNLCMLFLGIFTWIKHNQLENMVSRNRVSLKWRHNGHDGVLNHQPHDCLLKRLFRHRSKKTSKFHPTGLCGRWPVNSPRKWPVTWKMFSIC